MKYNAKKLNATEYAVFTGKRYWKATVTTNKAHAEERAISMSAAWHLEKARELMAEMEDRREGKEADERTEELASDVLGAVRSVTSYGYDISRLMDTEYCERDSGAWLA